MADAYLLFREVVLLLRGVVLYRLNIHLGHFGIRDLFAVESIIDDFHWADLLLGGLQSVFLIELLS